MRLLCKYDFKAQPQSQMQIQSKLLSLFSVKIPELLKLQGLV